MGALPPERAGVGSAVNDTTRELGGTLGVAIAGSLVASIYSGRVVDGLAGTPVPPEALDAAKDSVTGALFVAEEATNRLRPRRRRRSSAAWPATPTSTASCSAPGSWARWPSSAPSPPTCGCRPEPTSRRSIRTTGRSRSRPRARSRSGPRPGRARPPGRRGPRLHGGGRGRHHRRRAHRRRPRLTGADQRSDVGSGREGQTMSGRRCRPSSSKFSSASQVR